MYDEAQYFAPVTTDDSGVHVHLGADHPGVNDADYRARRDALAALALAWRVGDPVPYAEYTDAEHEVWRAVSHELAVKHRKYACREFLDGASRLRLPENRVPQLAEVSAALQPITGFTYRPAAGLVPLRDFYGALADGVFHSTQYVRHHSVPFYTPEPDVIHEVVGHANALASDRFARLYRLAGRAARAVETEDALEFVSRVFWFTLEFGVLHEGGELRACGAGILSSFGEIEQFRSMSLLPLDIGRMGSTTYDITTYQTTLFAAESFDHLEDVVGGFFESCTDETIARHSAGVR